MNIYIVYMCNIYSLVSHDNIELNQYIKYVSLIDLFI